MDDVTVPSPRRTIDLEQLVWRWVADGRVRPDVAARFMAERRQTCFRRWRGAGQPRRRDDDAAESSRPPRAA